MTWIFLQPSTSRPSHVHVQRSIIWPCAYGNIMMPICNTDFGDLVRSSIRPIPPKRRPASALVVVIWVEIRGSIRTAPLKSSPQLYIVGSCLLKWRYHSTGLLQTFKSLFWGWGPAPKIPMSGMRINPLNHLSGVLTTTYILFSCFLDESMNIGRKVKSSTSVLLYPCAPCDLPKAFYLYKFVDGLSLMMTHGYTPLFSCFFSISLDKCCRLGQCDHGHRFIWNRPHSHSVHVSNQPRRISSFRE